MVAAVSSGIRRSTGPGWALRRDFARLLVLAVVLPTLALVVFLSWSEANANRAMASERLRTLAQWTARDIDDFLGVHRAAVQVLAERRSQERTVSDAARWQVDFRRMRARYPGLAGLLVTDARGRVVASDPSPPGNGGSDVSDRAYFAAVRNSGDDFVSGVFRDRVLGADPLVAVSAPVRIEGRFAGVVASAMNVGDFARLRGEWLNVRGIEALLLDRDSQVIYASDGAAHAPLDALAATPFGRAIESLPTMPSQGPPVLRHALRDGGDAYAVRAPLDSGWQLVLMLPRKQLDAQQWQDLLRMLAVVGLIAATVLAIAWWQMRRLSASVQRLLERMQRVALDHASAPISPDSMPHELSPLADALNQLSERLGDAYHTTSASLAEQRRLRESLEQMVSAREREIAERTQELRGAVDELDRLSRTDALTGCLNYRGFREVTARLWHESHESGRPLAALALDIDYFKAYNDRYGHPQGDGALRRFAGAVRSALYRREDVVVRPGGEEFIVFLPDTTLQQAILVGERIVASVRQADIVHAGSPLGVLSVSIGVACRLDDDGSDPEVMLTRADAALYRAKGGGRNRVSL
ncbi:MAG TPA: diguanylate cyclase [Lysobacter sp.]|nr:diguanylate cyclase [Lysobacter sp.]